MGFIDRMKAEALKNQKKLVLPEGTDKRVINAAKILADEGLVAEVWLVGDEGAVLNAAKAEHQEYEIEYDLNDIVQWGLAGLPDSAQRRAKLCDKLSIGHCNAKQLVKKLNSYQIPREEIEAML